MATPVNYNSTNKLPDFLCVGVEKCGSTTLYDLLKQHPLIGLSRYKETHFFNSNWDKGLDWYQEKFSHLSNNTSDNTNQCLGEITPAYHRFPEVIPRIKNTLGDETKIIILLREPRKRAFSHYIHDFARHQEITDRVYKRYLATCPYTPIVQNYFDAFGKGNCLVLVFEEDILPSQQKLMDKVCAFLKLDSAPASPVHSNASCLPVIANSPDHDSQILFETENQPLKIPANSLVIYTGHSNTTKTLTALSSSTKKQVEDQVSRAVSCIPALKSSIIFEQNVEQDLLNLEALLNRSLNIWREPLVDLQARFAHKPIFSSL